MNICFISISLIIKEAKSMSKQKLKRGTNSVFQQKVRNYFRCSDASMNQILIQSIFKKQLYRLSSRISCLLCGNGFEGSRFKIGTICMMYHVWLYYFGSHVWNILFYLIFYILKYFFIAGWTGTATAQSKSHSGSIRKCKDSQKW